jgi:DNA-binding transcriptional MerR regulator
MLLKIGDLAKRVGLSVRALHHYDAIGLLSPSARSESGARLYGVQDLVRLHRIQALKELGYSLPDIRAALDDANADPLEVIERQMAELDAQAGRAQALRQRLQQLAAQLSGGGEGAASDWLDLLEMMGLHHKHFTQEEVHALRNPKGQPPAELEARWRRLASEVRQAMDRGLAPASAEAQALAWRWVRMVIALTSNSPVLARKLKAMHEQERRAQEIMGITPALLDWIGQAIAHARTALFARHLSPEEAAEVGRRQLAGRAYMNEWPALLALVREQMDAAAPPTAVAVQALMLRWRDLFRESHCGDDERLEAKVRAALAREPDLMLGVGVDEALMNYVRQAREAR